jgi:hypothetical protein
MTITYERIKLPTERCSVTWCDLPTDHDSRAPEGVRMHSLRLAECVNDGQRIRIEIEAPTQIVAGVETVQSPVINLYVGETGGDDMAPERARTVAAFISVGLNMAADRVEEIEREILGAQR